jgi:hypothetical protein
MPTDKHLQWVNLSRNPDFVEDDVAALKCLGPVHYEVTFKKAQAADYRVRVVPTAEALTYEATEIARNRNAFTIRQTRAQTNRGKKKVRVTEDVFLPAAGGNTYKIRAKYKKTIKETDIVETRRRLYYQPMAMDGIAVPNTATTETYYETLFVVLKSKGGTGAIPHRTNVRSDDWVAGRLPLIRAAKAAWKLRKYEPWACAVAFVDMIASRQEKEYLPAVSPLYSVGRRILHWGTREITFQLPANEYVWWELEPDDDAANGGRGEWLVSRSCKFVEADGTEHDIPDENVSIDLTVKRTALGGYGRLKIVIPADVRDVWSSKTGRIRIKLRVVKGFSGGYSEPRINIITVAQRAWWSDNSEPKRLQILAHEMGHKIGMVPEGLGTSLDAGPGLYGGTLNPTADQKGHQGPHCSAGVAYAAGGAPAPWTGAPGCVMFGATSCFDPLAVPPQHVASPSIFCPDCEWQVMKLDLNGFHLPGFRTSIRSQ